MKNAGFAWTTRLLDDYIADPQKTLPGNLMPFSGVADARQRADLIAYLITLRCGRHRAGVGCAGAVSASDRRTRAKRFARQHDAAGGGDLVQPSPTPTASERHHLGRHF